MSEPNRITMQKRKILDEDDSTDVDDVQNDAVSEEDYLMNGEIDQITEEEGGLRIGEIYIPPAPAPALSFDTKGPRLIITHIINENFKSYAGVQTLGPFHKSFTAIIGPNGSGKSNVIDSMLFVFGYRATKIRSKKISVLIHSSSKFPNLPYATVSVHFSLIIDGEGDDFEEVPDSNIVVSRTAFKDNSSVYNYNGKRVQFKEVAKILRSHGIDLDHNRFLILQGEVEQIAMMKPKGANENESGMLEYLEDIIGTSRYKEPLKQLAAKVDEYTEARKEKLNRVRLVEAEKLKLEEPMKHAVELINLTNNSLRTRNMLLQKYIHETNKIIIDKEKELQELKENLAKIDEKLSKVKEELQEKNTVLKTGMQKFDKLKQKKEEITEKLLSCKKKTVIVLADHTQCCKKKKNLEQLLEQEKGKHMDLELVPNKNNREIEECEKLLTRHREAKATADEELQTTVASVRNQTKGLQDQKDKLQAKLMQLNQIVHEVNAQYKLTESKLKLCLNSETTEAKKLERKREAYEKAAKDLDEKKLQQENLTSTVPENEKKLEEIQNKLETLKKEETNVVREVRNLRSQLEESRQAMSANHSRGRVLDSLMKEKRNGKLPGIFGRLGDLGGIDKKYDIAISTCCGPLDNIVVDTVETAQACVEYLKRYNVGRATFIALDKQQHLMNQINKTIKYPENVKRLFDLVKVKDERVLPAFYFALRETLIADDLEQASRIAYGSTRYRVVTLLGDVIEIAGTMSGGGKSKTRGRMSTAVQQDTSEQDPEAIQAKESKLVKLEQRLTEIRAELSDLDESSVALQEITRQGRVTLNKLTIEIRGLADQVPAMEAQFRQQAAITAKCKVDKNKKEQLEAALSAEKEKLEKAKHDAAEVEKEVHGVDAQISTLAGGKVKVLQKSVDEIAKKIEKVSTEISKLKVGINNSIRNAKKSKDKINQMENDLKDTDKNIESLNEQKKQLTLDSQQFQKDIEELEDEISEGTGTFSDLKKDISKLQTEENKIKSERLEANDAVTKMKKTVQDCKSKTPMWDKELASLKLEDPGVEDIPGIEALVPFAKHTPEELEEAVVEELRNRLQAQKARIGEDKPSIQAVRDYKAKEVLYLRRAAELDEITKKRNEMRDVFDQLTKKRSNDFMEGFSKISNKLKEMYQMITLGGDAELELVDSMDAFVEGITFSVRPPNKSWKNISNLSGGEKTLSSLALVFALHYYKPTPLYVMDEIDAALDFKNVSIVANYIKDRTKNAQFIIISLRYNMFEVSNRLVGIYKTEDCTKCVTIDNKRVCDTDPARHEDENAATALFKTNDDTFNFKLGPQNFLEES